MIIGSLYATIVIGALICCLYYVYEILWEHIDARTTYNKVARGVADAKAGRVRPYRKLREETFSTAFIPQEKWEEATMRMMEKHSHALDMLKDK